MITYLLNAIGLDPALASTEFGLFAGLLIAIIAIFGISKMIFVLFQGFFGGGGL